jgi:hypothetical protein
VIFEYANNAHTTLATPIGPTATSLTVAASSGALFPTITTGQAFYCTLLDAATLSISEIVEVTARSGDVFTIVRGQQGTTAKSWVSGSIVTQLITAGDLQNFVQSAQLPSFGQTTYPATFNNSGTGAASGTTFNGGTPQTISWNTLGAVASAAFTGTNQSLATNGFQKLPGGLMIQWGKFAQSAYQQQVGPVIFPTAFTGAPYCVVATPYIPDSSYSGADLWVQIENNTITSTQFYAYYQATATSISQPLAGFTWIAIGRA